MLLGLKFDSFIIFAFPPKIAFGGFSLVSLSGVDAYT